MPFKILNIWENFLIMHRVFVTNFGRENLIHPPTISRAASPSPSY